MLQGGARPAFPAGAPAAYVDLAAACWAAGPQARPAMGEVMRRLALMADGMAAAAPAQGA